MVPARSTRFLGIQLLLLRCRIVNAIEENSGIGIFLNIGATNVILLNIFLQFTIVGKLFARFSSLWDFKF